MHFFQLLLLKKKCYKMNVAIPDIYQLQASFPSKPSTRCKARTVQLGYCPALNEASKGHMKKKILEMDGNG